MPVTSLHPQYVALSERWRKCLDFSKGAAAVEAAGTLYLPKLDGHTDGEYQAYLKRTKFYSAVSRTIAGLVGCVFRKEPIINKPVSGLDDVLKDVTGQGQTFEGFAKDCAGDQLAAGRRGVLIDVPAKEANPARPYLVAYSALDIINWRVETVDDEKKLTLVVLSEWVEVPVVSDPYARKLIQQWRVLALNDANAGTGKAPNMAYTQTVIQRASDIVRLDPTRNGDPKYKPMAAVNADPNKVDKFPKSVFVSGTAVDVDTEGYVIVFQATPTRSGLALDSIPFVFIGSRDTGPDVDAIPIEDLVEVNHSHYLTSAGYGHALFFCGLPTPYAFGPGVGVSQFEKDAATGELKEIKVLKIGSGTAWTGPEENTKVGFLEFTGSGVAPLKEALDDDKTEMAVLGARFLEEQKAAAEAADSKRINQAGDSSTLATISGTLSDGLTKVYYWLAYWRGQDATATTVEANTEFFDTSIDAPTLVALVAACQGNLITSETFLYNLGRGGFLPPGVTAADEADKVSAIVPPGLRTLPAPVPVVDPTKKPVPAAA